MSIRSGGCRRVENEDICSFLLFVYNVLVVGRTAGHSCRYKLVVPRVSKHTYFCLVAKPM